MFAHIGARLYYHGGYCTVTNLQVSYGHVVVYLEFDNTNNKEDEMNGWYSVESLEADSEVWVQSTIPMVANL